MVKDSIPSPGEDTLPSQPPLHSGGPVAGSGQWEAVVFSNRADFFSSLMFSEKLSRKLGVPTDPVRPTLALLGHLALLPHVGHNQ